MPNYIVVKTYTCDVEAEDPATALEKAEALFYKDPSSYSSIDVEEAEYVTPCGVLEARATPQDVEELQKRECEGNCPCSDCAD